MDSLSLSLNFLIVLPTVGYIIQKNSKISKNLDEIKNNIESLEGNLSNIKNNFINTTDGTLSDIINTNDIIQNKMKQLENIYSKTPIPTQVNNNSLLQINNITLLNDSTNLSLSSLTYHTVFYLTNNQILNILNLSLNTTNYNVFYITNLPQSTEILYIYYLIDLPNDPLTYYNLYPGDLIYLLWVNNSKYIIITLSNSKLINEIDVNDKDIQTIFNVINNDIIPYINNIPTLQNSIIKIDNDITAFKNIYDPKIETFDIKFKNISDSVKLEINSLYNILYLTDSTIKSNLYISLKDSIFYIINHYSSTENLYINSSNFILKPSDCILITSDYVIISLYDSNLPNIINSNITDINNIKNEIISLKNNTVITDNSNITYLDFYNIFYLTDNKIKSTLNINNTKLAILINHPQSTEFLYINTYYILPGEVIFLYNNIVIPLTNNYLNNLANIINVNIQNIQNDNNINSNDIINIKNILNNKVSDLNILTMELYNINFTTDSINIFKISLYNLFYLTNVNINSSLNLGINTLKLSSFFLFNHPNSTESLSISYLNNNIPSIFILYPSDSIIILWINPEYIIIPLNNNNIIKKLENDLNNSLILINQNTTDILKNSQDIINIKNTVNSQSTTLNVLTTQLSTLSKISDAISIKLTNYYSIFILTDPTISSSIDLTTNTTLLTTFYLINSPISTEFLLVDKTKLYPGDVLILIWDISKYIVVPMSNNNLFNEFLKLQNSITSSSNDISFLVNKSNLTVITDSSNIGLNSLGYNVLFYLTNPLITSLLTLTVNNSGINIFYLINHPSSTENLSIDYMTGTNFILFPGEIILVFWLTNNYYIISLTSNTSISSLISQTNTLSTNLNNLQTYISGQLTTLVTNIQNTQVSLNNLYNTINNVVLINDKPTIYLSDLRYNTLFYLILSSSILSLSVNINLPIIFLSNSLSSTKNLLIYYLIKLSPTPSTYYVLYPGDTVMLLWISSDYYIIPCNNDYLLKTSNSTISTLQTILNNNTNTLNTNASNLSLLKTTLTNNTNDITTINSTLGIQSSLSYELNSFNILLNAATYNQTSLKYFTVFYLTINTLLRLSSLITTYTTFAIYNHVKSTANISIYYLISLAANPSTYYIVYPGDLIYLTWMNTGSGYEYIIIPVNNYNLLTNVTSSITQMNSLITSISSNTTAISSLQPYTTTMTNLDTKVTTQTLMINNITNCTIFSDSASITSLSINNIFILTNAAITSVLRLSINTSSVSKFFLFNSSKSTQSLKVYYLIDLAYNITTTYTLLPGQKCILLWSFINNKYIYEIYDDKIVLSPNSFLNYTDNASGITLGLASNFFFTLTQTYHTTVNTSNLLSLPVFTPINFINSQLSTSQLLINLSTISNNNIYLFPGESCQCIINGALIPINYPKTTTYFQSSNFFNRIFYTNIISPDNLRMKLLCVNVVSNKNMLLTNLIYFPNRLFGAFNSTIESPVSFSNFTSPYALGHHLGIYLDNFGLRMEAGIYRFPTGSSFVSVIFT
jgi:hypothetical protein